MTAIDEKEQARFATTTDDVGRFEFVLEGGNWTISPRVANHRGFTTTLSVLPWYGSYNIDGRRVVGATPIRAILPARGEGIRPLAEGDSPQAIAEGEGVADEAVFLNRYSLASENLMREVQDQPLLRAPFRASIVTPYIRLAAAAAEAKRKFRESPKPDLTRLNSEAVQVVVAPSSSLFTADSIESVVIKRNGEILKPIKSFTRPSVFQTAAGLQEQLNEGVFLFDVKAFDPTSDITIVFVGKSGNFEWPIDGDKLSQWR